MPHFELPYTFDTVLRLSLHFGLPYSQGLSKFCSDDGNGMVDFVIIGLTTGSGAILLYYYGLRYIPARISTICELCFPISSVVFDFY